MFSTVGFGVNAFNTVTFGQRKQKVRNFDRQQKNALKEYLATLQLDTWVNFNTEGKFGYAYNSGRVIEKTAQSIKVRDAGGSIYLFNIKTGKENEVGQQHDEPQQIFLTPKK